MAKFQPLIGRIEKPQARGSYKDVRALISAHNISTVRETDKSHTHTRTHTNLHTQGTGGILVQLRLCSVAQHFSAEIQQLNQID